MYPRLRTIDVPKGPINHLHLALIRGIVGVALRRSQVAVAHPLLQRPHRHPRRCLEWTRFRGQTDLPRLLGVRSCCPSKRVPSRHYDARGDVLYLNIDAPRSAVRSLEIDGGHAVHYDEFDSIIGLTLLNIRRTIEAEGYVDLRLPVDAYSRCGQPSRGVRVYIIETRARWPRLDPR